MKFLTILIILGASGFAQTADPLRWTAPAVAAAKQNPLRNNPELANGGKKVYLKLCTSCHVSGTSQRKPDLSSHDVQQETDGALFWKISTGDSRSGMPAYGSLPDGQRWQIVLYIRTLASQDR